MSTICSRAFGSFSRRFAAASTPSCTPRLASARFTAPVVRHNSTEATPKQADADPKDGYSPGDMTAMYQHYRDMHEKQKNILNYLKSIAPGWIKSADLYDTGEVWIDIPRQKLDPLLDLLKNHTNFSYKACKDIYSIDRPESTERFEVQYCLLSHLYNSRLMLKLQVPQDVMVESATKHYASANWLEREIYDMMGIPFANHPDLRRILTDYGFQGFPLRKDFPLSGYTEVRYDDELKRVVHEPTELTQEFRAFDFTTPWEKIDAKK